MAEWRLRVAWDALVAVAQAQFREVPCKHAKPIAQAPSMHKHRWVVVKIRVPFWVP